MLGKQIDVVASEKFDEGKFEYWLQYEMKAKGLGAPFEQAINTCVAVIKRNPETFALCANSKTIRAGIVDRRSRRRKKFPFLIFYQIVHESEKTALVELLEIVPESSQHKKNH